MKDKFNIPEIRFKEFTGAWEEKQFWQLSDIVRGASPRPINDQRWFDDKSDIGWLRISDVTKQGERVRYLEQRISRAGEEKTRVLHEPHLLLSIAASVGKPVINYVKTGVHDGFLIFLNPIFDQEFMYQWMKMFEGKWYQYGQPGSQVNLNSDIVKNQYIVIPKDKEQQKIGAYFQNFDKLLTLHKQKYDKLITLKKAMLEKMFPKEGSDVPEIRFNGFSGAWRQGDLSNAIDLRSGCDYKHLAKGEIPVYGTGGYMLSVNEALSYNEDAIGIGRKGTIDKPFILNAPFWTVDTLFYAVPRNNNDLHFINCVFQKINWKQRDESTGVPSLSKVAINSVQIQSPDIAEQQKIGTYFQNIDNLITQHQTQLAKLNNIKKACLEKMFV